MLNPRASNDTGHIFGCNRLVGLEILTQFFIKPRRGIKRRPSLCQTVPGGKIHSEIYLSIYLDILPKKLKLKYLVLRLEGWPGSLFLRVLGVQPPTPTCGGSQLSFQDVWCLLLAFRTTRHTCGLNTHAYKKEGKKWKTQIRSCSLRVVGFDFGVVLFGGWRGPDQPGSQLRLSVHGLEVAKCVVWI